MSNYVEVAELIWENGQLSMHGLGGLQSEKPITSRAHDTLESIVQQATLKRYQQPSKFTRQGHAPTSINSFTDAPSSSTRKRTWSNTNVNVFEECDILSGGCGCGCGCGCDCAIAGATFCRDNDATMMTWASLESGPSLKTMEDDSACHCGSEIRNNQDDRDSKAETGQSNSKRRSRTAAIHNQSERKRRDRINQKIKALQRLVPNANKTDKASMLDEVINYLKQLQAQIQMINMTSMSQMMVPFAMQQQLQMSMLAKMGGGLGMEMGLANINNMTAQISGPSPRSLPQLNIQQTSTPGTAPLFVAPSFMMPSIIPPKPQHASSASIPLPHPYTNSLNQPINMDILHNMAALYQQQMSQNNHHLSSSNSQPHHEQGR